MSHSFAWVCICILEGGHLSIPDADADPGMTGLALSPYRNYNNNDFSDFVIMIVNTQNNVQ
jgi:hypothetical protein